MLSTGVIYMNGALRAWGGRKAGGKATVGELSEAIALSAIPIFSWFVLSVAIVLLTRFTYGETWQWAMPGRHRFGLTLCWLPALLCSCGPEF